MQADHLSVLVLVKGVSSQHMKWGHHFLTLRPAPSTVLCVVEHVKSYT